MTNLPLLVVRATVRDLLSRGLLTRDGTQLRIPDRHRHAEELQALVQLGRRLCSPDRVGLRDHTPDPGHDRALDLRLAQLHPVHQGALVVRLEAAHFDARLLALGDQAGVDLLEGGVAVDLGLAGPEQVQVRPVEDEDAQRPGHGRPA